MASSVSKLLSGKFALVTGGGSGIGRAVCVLFANEGAKVAVADIKDEACKETLTLLKGASHSSHQLNVTESGSVTSLFQTLKEQHQSVPNVVVNCAGITRDGFLLSMEDDQFDDVINVNLKGTFLVTREACRSMIDNECSQGASVINISSIIAKMGNMGQCNYSASKAGVEAFTKSAAKELAAAGIRCNTVMPGFIDTPMVQTVPDKLKTMLLKMIPMHRMGKPEEVAEVCAFLASDRSSYVTGTTIDVSGGFYS